MTTGSPDSDLTFAEQLARRVITRLGRNAPPLRVEQVRYHHGFDTDRWEMAFSDEPADDIRITVRIDDIGAGAIGANLSLTTDRAQAVAAVATHIQNHVLEYTHGTSLPPCPGHVHPLDPKVHDGVACWVCPKDPAHHAEPILPADA